MLTGEPDKLACIFGCDWDLYLLVFRLDDFPVVGDGGDMLEDVFSTEVELELSSLMVIDVVAQLSWTWTFAVLFEMMSALSFESCVISTIVLVFSGMGVSLPSFRVTAELSWFVFSVLGDSLSNSLVRLIVIFVEVCCCGWAFF